MSKLTPNIALDEVEPISVAVAVIQRQDGAILLAERPIGKVWAGYWEFPGGKIERFETPTQAVSREAEEELGIRIHQPLKWLMLKVGYPAQYDAEGNRSAAARKISLHCFRVSDWQGHLHGREGQRIAWQNPAHLQLAPLLPVNTPILKALTLPSLCAISSVEALGESAFLQVLERALGHGLRMLVVREKNLEPSALRALLARIMRLAQPYKARIIVHGFKEWAGQADGLHISAKQLMNLRHKPAVGLVGASCHNQQELEQAVQLGLDYVWLGAVQATPSHPNILGMGWSKFAQLIAEYPLPVYALGGLSASDLNMAQQCGAHGISMQRAIERL